MTRHGEAGEARLGWAGRGLTWQDRASQARRGTAWHGEAGLREARHGLAHRGIAGATWLGKAGRAGLGKMWQSVAGEARRSRAGRDVAGGAR